MLNRASDSDVGDLLSKDGVSYLKVGIWIINQDKLKKNIKFATNICK
jgi:hypothetical protein